jgi:hypothetical protein
VKSTGQSATQKSRIGTALRGLSAIDCPLPWQWFYSFVSKASLQKTGVFAIAAGDFREFSAQKVRPISLWRLKAMRKTRVWRAFLITERKFSENETAWLGREGSNLRVAESKSAVHPNWLREPDLDQRPQGHEPDDRRNCKSQFHQAVSKQKSNHLARNRLAFLSKPSIAVRTGSRLKRAFGPSPAGSFTWVGLRWCGE